MSHDTKTIHHIITPTMSHHNNDTKQTLCHIITHTIHHMITPTMSHHNNDTKKNKMCDRCGGSESLCATVFIVSFQTKTYTYTYTYVYTHTYTYTYTYTYTCTYTHTHTHTAAFNGIVSNKNTHTHIHFKQKTYIHTYITYIPYILAPLKKKHFGAIKKTRCVIDAVAASRIVRAGTHSEKSSLCGFI